MENTSQNITFHDCYEACLSLNFGVVGPESIRAGYATEDDERLPSIRSTWRRLGVPLAGLCAYRVVTNATNSTILVYALGFSVTDASDSPADPSTPQ